MTRGAFQVLESQPPDEVVGSDVVAGVSDGAASSGRSKPQQETAQSFAARKSRWLIQIAQNRNLSALAVRLGIVLAEHMNRRIGYAFPSVERLATLLNSDSKNVRRATAVLEEAGHLTVTRKSRPGRSAVNHYSFRYVDRA